MQRIALVGERQSSVESSDTGYLSHARSTDGVARSTDGVARSADGVVVQNIHNYNYDHCQFVQHTHTNIGITAGSINTSKSASQPSNNVVWRDVM